MTATLGEFTRWLEELIPPAFQEQYDNSGLQVGDPDASINSVLLTVDVTSEVIAEAREHGCNLIISHHPLIFTPLKRIAGGSETELCVASAVRGGIAIYSAHTSFDNVSWGVSHILAEKIGLTKIRVLAPLKGKLSKLIAFVPVAVGFEHLVALHDVGLIELPAVRVGLEHLHLRLGRRCGGRLPRHRRHREHGHRHQPQHHRDQPPHDASFWAFPRPPSRYAPSSFSSSACNPSGLITLRCGIQ